MSQNMLAIFTDKLNKEENRFEQYIAKMKRKIVHSAGLAYIKSSFPIC